MFRRLARGESAFFLHKHYNGCVPRMSARNTLGAGNELEPAYNAGLTDKGHFLGLKRIREKPLRVVWIDTEQFGDLAPKSEQQGGGFNGEYVGADGNTYYNASRNFLTRSLFV